MKLFLFIQFTLVIHCSVFAEETFTYKNFVKTNDKLIYALDKSKQSEIEALEALQKWAPEDHYLKTYKQFWTALWSVDNKEAKSLYELLKKEKKFLRLRLELLRKLLDNSSVSQNYFIQKESQSLLKQLKGTSEGELFESDFLRWLQKNKLFDVVCRTERSRWIVEPEISFVEMYAGVENCPIVFEDFLLRLRRLIFAAKDFQAQREIEQFIQIGETDESKKAGRQLLPWQKAYLQAIFDSNVGDSVKAFQDLVPFEKEILQSDYDDNYFYIAQRAGELKKAEEIIQKVISNSKGIERHELVFQQGFLFYQTKQYEKAYKIFDQQFNELSPRKNKKRKMSRRKLNRNLRELDQVSWLRAWVLFLDQKYEQSLKAFELTKDFTSDQARLNYWMAVNYLKLGQASNALILFKKLAQPILDQKSYGYYSLLGWLRYESYKREFKNNEAIKNVIQLTKSNFSQYPAPDDKVTRSQLLQHYNELADESFETDEGEIQVVNTENEIMDSEELKGLDIKSEKDLALQIFWSKLLIEQNKADYAKWHMFEIEKNIKDRKIADPITKFYLEKEFYYRALSLQNKLNTQSPNLHFKADPVYWGALYPEAYKKDVLHFSGARKLDPHLMWSIMKAETQYKSDAISPVGAVGLMQFMPYTLQKVTKLISKDSLKTEDLFIPKNSIEVGAAYLKKLSLELDYQRPLIASAYNGGPHRVKQWLKNLGQIEYDVFIEHIPFAETRTYTKRVLTFKSMYDRLYISSMTYDNLKYLIEKIPYTPPTNFKPNEEWNISIQ